MYMYQMLSTAVFDVDNRNKIQKSWSPNAIKSIVILRDCILVVYHTTRATKKIELTEEALNDIQSDGRKGSLHNVLNAYQLSCLEEIYIDSVFKAYGGTLDLVKYVQSLISTKSRLRYYGYIAWNQGTGDRIKMFYEQGKSHLAEDYTLAITGKGIAQVENYSTNNLDWYTKYNLRPDSYSMDKERGILESWFTKVKNDVGSYQSKILENEKLKVEVENCYIRLKNEIARAEDIKLWYNMVSAIKSGKKNMCSSPVVSWITDNGKFTPSYRVDIDVINKVLSTHPELSKMPELNYIMKFLNSQGCFDKVDEGDNKKGKIVNDNNYFVNINWTLGGILEKITKTYGTNTVEALLFNRVVKHHGTYVIGCERAEVMGIPTGELMNIIFETCGFNREYLRKRG